MLIRCSKPSAELVNCCHGGSRSWVPVTMLHGNVVAPTTNDLYFVVSVGQALGCSSAVWFGPGAPGEVAIRGWLWFRSRQRLVCSRVWSSEETLVQLGAGTEGTSWTSLPTPMSSFHVSSPAWWHQGHQTSLLAQGCEGVCHKRERTGS